MPIGNPKKSPIQAPLAVKAVIENQSPFAQSNSNKDHGTFKMPPPPPPAMSIQTKKSASL